MYPTVMSDGLRAEVNVPNSGTAKRWSCIRMCANLDVIERNPDLTDLYAWYFEDILHYGSEE